MVRVVTWLFLWTTIITAQGEGWFEPFANAAGSGGTAYAPGQFLFGQINEQGKVWYALTNTPVPPATGLPTIVSGSLSYPGLPPSSGNCISIPPQTGVMGRLTLGFAVTTGEVYFSFLLKVTDISAVDTTGTQNNFFAGFGDTIGSQNATLLRAATRVYARRSGSGFNLGVSRNSHNTGDWVFETTQRALNQIYLVVGRYNYDDHTASLWINPPGASLGGNSAPAANITATKGNDLNSNGIRAFVLGCRTNAPPGCLVDELRVATTWRSVTGGLDEDPVILAQPSSQAVPEDGVARLDVTASGTGPLSYQWYKGSTALQGQGDILGVTSATLVLSNVTAANAGAYRVAVTNALGAGLVSSDAELYVTGPAPRPNVVFILCDDLGYGDLGVLWQNSRSPGLPRHATPKLDTFASEGIQLRNHYCGAPVCAPSRASLLLGMHQGHANVRNEQWNKALAANHTLGSVLKQAGYATALIGKWGLGGDDLGGSTPAEWPAYPTRRGFDYFFGYEKHGDGHEHYPKDAPYSGKSKECYDGNNSVTPLLDKCYTADLFTARAKKWIRDQHSSRPGQPFLLFLSFDTPHAAYELPTQTYPSGGGLNGGMQWLGAPGQMINTASGTIDSFVHPEYAAATYDHDGDPQTAEVAWPETFQRYATSVRRIDDAVGDIGQLLRDLGVETNTIVVFTSDNGPTTEEYLGLVPRYAANFFDTFGPLDGIKRDLWEGGVRVPTLVRWPGAIPQGTVSGTPSQFQDWLPTFCELTGLPAPASSDGVSLMPTFTGIGKQRPSTIYVEYADIYSTPSYPEFETSHRGRVHNQMQLVHVNGLKGIRHDIRSHADDFEVYDVAADPKETTNMAAAPALIEVQQRMKDRVLRLRRGDSSAPRPYDDELVSAVEYPVLPGVVWQVRTQALPWVPEMRSLLPDLRGSTNSPTLAVCGGLDNAAVLYSGYIQAPAAGEYSFYLSTDTRAFLRLHDATLVDADFGYPGNVEVSGSIQLQAGLHPFRLCYMHRKSASPTLGLVWSGPGISKQSIPDEMFFRDKPSAAWHREHFGELDPKWDADDDLDGRSRLAEYAFGGDPMMADSSDIVDVWLFDDHLQMQFLRRLPGTHDLNYGVQTSTDLVHWVPATMQEATRMSATVPGFEKVVCALRIASEQNARQYVRWTATLQ